MVVFHFAYEFMEHAVPSIQQTKAQSTNEIGMHNEILMLILILDLHLTMD